ncbi:hypothetical protein C1I98_20510 [Spongiactinospora gelatinilytica]|uniref:Cytochrome P450 n=1 Tax=Spongiactinospora gelatinilytica TaxID=2666298 RepID=A0A2W2FWI4_9ACTN|nr:hypothetical protein C1I98_20510 [Spongiactinospora gelatinilytica]
MTWPDIVPGPVGTPSPEFARRRESGPLAPATMPSGDRVPAAVGYDDVRAVLSAPASSRDLRGPGLPRMVSGTAMDDDPVSLINQDPPVHTRYRRILSGPFSPRHTEPWRPRVATVARALLDGLGDDFELVQAYAMKIPGRVICELLGVPADHHTQFIRFGPKTYRAGVSQPYREPFPPVLLVEGKPGQAAQVSECGDFRAIGVKADERLSRRRVDREQHVGRTPAKRDRMQPERPGDGPGVRPFRHVLEQPDQVVEPGNLHTLSPKNMSRYSAFRAPAILTSHYGPSEITRFCQAG